MRLNFGKVRYKRKGNDYTYRHRSTFTRRIWNWFSFCPTIFIVNLDNSPGGNPCRSDDEHHTFHPEKFAIGVSNQWWSWLQNADLKGKVVVEFYFSAWYSNFLHEDPAMDVMESGTLRISFSDKGSAVMFKLAFACPELKLAHLASS